jgi:hypothetical protein
VTKLEQHVRKRLSEPLDIRAVTLPTGSRILDVRTAGKEAVEEASVVVGLPFTPEEFVEQALKLPHPTEAAMALDRPLAEAILAIAEQGPHRMEHWRRQVLAKWTERASHLQAREAQLHASMDPEVAAVLEGKRLLLFKEMLDEVGFQDPSLVTEMAQGFRLVGLLPCSGEFSPAA